MERNSVFSSLMEMTVIKQTDQPVTPKSQMEGPSAVKRWASVVKAQKNSLTSSKLDNKQNDIGSETSTEIFDCHFQKFLEDFESHKGFISENRNMFTCNVCCIELESMLKLANHLKTRKHEDNIITFLKDKLPIHLHHVMEYVSFCGSNLCCNLCCCKIDMSSDNPFKIITNIVAHNSNSCHRANKTTQENFNFTNSLIKSLVTANADINPNLHNFIEKKMVPQFQCKLCKKLIAHDGEGNILKQSLSDHLKSVDHLKNQKAYEVLNLFSKVSSNGKDSFYILSGNITCIYCKHEVETDVEKMVIHINGVEHASNMFANIGMDSSLNVSKNRTTSEAKLLVSKGMKRTFIENEKCQKIRKPTKHSEFSSNDFLSTLPSSLILSDCIIENDKGSLTCLICDSVVSPSPNNIKSHLHGINHKKTKDIILKSPENPDSLRYIVKDDNGMFNCFICRCSLTPSTDHFKNHLKSLHHKLEEMRRMRNCSDCPLASSLLETIPLVIKTLKCHKPEKVESSVLDQLFTLLLKKSLLLSVNIDFLVKNVDGKHTYCKLCKTLIPVSLDIDILEGNINEHLKGNNHKLNFLLKNVKVTLTPKEKSEKTDNVVRSLFSTNSNVNEREDIKTSRINHNTTLFISKTRNITNTNLDPNENNTESFDKLNDFAQNQDGLPISPKSEVLIFRRKYGSNESFAKETKESSSLPCHHKTRKGLPVTKLSNIQKNEIETNEEVLLRRQKQIDYGKNTEGYFRYCKLVPQLKRGLDHPVTPPRHLKCSRRTWDGLIRAWRKQLHLFDSSNINSSLESDIQPLGL